MTSPSTTPERNVPGRWLEHGPLASLRSEMDGLFENFFGTPASSALSGAGVPSVDVVETDDAIEVTTDLPGFSAKDIDIEIRHDQLTISGQMSEEKESENGKNRRYHRVERRTGSFSRSVRLPCEVSQENVDAELQDGVLTVKMLKQEQERSRKIPVKG